MEKATQLYNLLASKDMKKEIIELMVSDSEFYSKEQRELDIQNIADVYDDETIDNYIKVFSK